MAFILRDLEENAPLRRAAASTLQRKGWIVVDISHIDVPDWQRCFADVFQAPAEAKEAAGKYRGSHGVSVGYKQDDHREFLECHRRTDGIVSPDYTSVVASYQSTVQALYDVQSRVATCVLQGIAAVLELDERVFLDLTDLPERGILPPIETKKTFDAEFAMTSPDDHHDNVLASGRHRYQALSASVLRVCIYDGRDDHPPQPQPQPPQPPQPPQSHPKTMFGAHTDTSFLTLGMTSSTPGLEILDLETDEWVCPEQLFPWDPNRDQPHMLTVFTGEFLQMLTKQHFAAAIHRVTAFTPAVRYSCPFIIRGRDERCVSFHDPTYVHPGGNEVLTREYIPNLEETPFGTIHKLLDMKRSKCFRAHEDDPHEWVLAAYPVRSKHFPSQSST